MQFTEKEGNHLGEFCKYQWGTQRVRFFKNLALNANKSDDQHTTPKGQKWGRWRNRPVGSNWGRIHILVPGMAMSSSWHPFGPSTG